MSVTLFPPLVIEAPLRPFGKQRPRFSRRGHTYKSAEQACEERAMSAYISQAMRSAGVDAVLVGPVAIELTVWYPIPRSYSRKKTELALSGQLFPLGRPDVDNLLKHFMDVATGLVWRDDAQVVRAVVMKRYGAQPLWRAVVCSGVI